MKKLIALLLPALLAGAALSAQTPEEILSRMDQETNRFEAEGFSMVMEIRLPILGTFSTTIYSRGDKYKMVTDMHGDTDINWSDGVTDWNYDSAKNTITIENSKPGEESDAESNAKLLSSVTEGYDVRLKKEDAGTWQLRCTKSRTNTNKDDPKNMDLVIDKATYLPILLKATVSGVTVSMRDFKPGVSEESITFDASRYPHATIIDKR